MANDLIPHGTDQPNVLHALTRKRAEIAGQIEHTQQILRRHIAELDSVEPTIRLFDPDIDVRGIGAKPVPARHRAFKGEVTRTVLQCLRMSRVPLTSHDIAMTLMRNRGLNPEERGLMVLMTKRVIACLGVQRKKGVAAPTAFVGRMQGWELVLR